MFCFQCQETLNNQGCTKQGVCGKPSEVAVLQDLLLFMARGISFWANSARDLGVEDGQTNDFVVKALFTTVTNVNFDPESIEKKVLESFAVRERMRTFFQKAFRDKNGKEYIGWVPEAAAWEGTGGRPQFLEKGASIGVQRTADADIRSLRELLTYGLKGIAAYADHALILGYRDPGIFAFLQEGLAATLDDSRTFEELFGLVSKAGKTAVDVMRLLDRANREIYGTPEITEVFTGTVAGPAILVSGHDLKDFAELLEQTQGMGVNVYTHGEMLPANAYPAFKKYKHLIGNFGTSWWNQQREFAEFKGAILFTTNCIQRPGDSYRDRVFTTGLVGWPGLVHIPDRPDGGEKDFSAVIAKARQLGGLSAKPGKRIPIGFHHQTVLGMEGKLVAAVKSGAIKRFFVMGGCDGRHKSREYFSELARKLPGDTVILTAGCAKYRYNMLDLGTIGGIPRVIDAGQCNDSYSLAVVAMKLAEAFGVESVNRLPISFAIGWYEQKAVAVLLALLHLGIKGIRVGPTLPAFLSNSVLKVLVDKFDLRLITTVDQDLPQMLADK